VHLARCVLLPEIGKSFFNKPSASSTFMRCRWLVDHHGNWLSSKGKHFAVDYLPDAAFSIVMIRAATKTSTSTFLTETRNATSLPRESEGEFPWVERGQSAFVLYGERTHDASFFDIFRGCESFSPIPALRGHLRATRSVRFSLDEKWIASLNLTPADSDIFLTTLPEGRQTLFPFIKAVTTPGRSDVRVQEPYYSP